MWVMNAKIASITTLRWSVWGWNAFQNDFVQTKKARGIKGRLIDSSQYLPMFNTCQVLLRCCQLAIYYDVDISWCCLVVIFSCFLSCCFVFILRLLSCCGHAAMLSCCHIAMFSCCHVVMFSCCNVVFLTSCLFDKLSCFFFQFFML
jgi:hypothetical protein